MKFNGNAKQSIKEEIDNIRDPIGKVPGQCVTDLTDLAQTTKHLIPNKI
jgi:hypothetical protein